MDITGDILETLKTTKFFRELIFLIGGMGFLIILYYFRYPQLLNKIYIPSLNKPENDLILLGTAYLVGRIIISFTKILDFIFFLVSSSAGIYRQKKRGIKLTIKAFFQFRSEEALSPIWEDRRMILISDFHKLVDSLRGVSDHMEDNLHSYLFLKLFFIYSVMAVFLAGSTVIKIIAILISIFFLIILFIANRGDFLYMIHLQKSLIQKAGLDN